MIERIGDFLQKNLVVFVALCVVPLKWGIVRLCRDRESEAAALFAVPEDLCYVSLGLVLGDLVSANGAFRKHYSNSPHVSIDLCVVGALLLIAAVAIHQLFRATMYQYRGWRSAQEAKTKFLGTPATTVSDQDRARKNDNYMILIVRHLLLFCFAYMAQLGISLCILHYVGSVISGNR
jgi:hypothetical protein